MAVLVLNNAQVVFQVGLTNYDLSDHIRSISLATVHDIIETTQFGDTSKRRIAGLADNSVSFEFNQDFQAGSVESVIYPLLGTAVLCKIKPVNGSISSSNPEYSFSVLISEWTPLNGAVGELTTATVQWPISGDITKTP
jgi:hypothetical protein